MFRALQFLSRACIQLFLFHILPSQTSRASLPPLIDLQLDDIIRSPTHALLRTLLHRESSRHGWVLTVIAAFLSSRGLRDHTSNDHLITTIVDLRQYHAGMNAIQHRWQGTNASMAAGQVASKAPSWHAAPFKTAYEAVHYLQSHGLLRNFLIANLYLERLAVDPSLPGGESEGWPSSKMHAEILATIVAFRHFLCKDVASEPMAQRNSSSVEANGDTLPGKSLPPWQLATESLATLVKACPDLCLDIPSPLLARACRASFPIAVAFAQALERICQNDTAVPQDKVKTVLLHACLFDDATTAFIRSSLSNMFSAHVLGN